MRMKLKSIIKNGDKNSKNVIANVIGAFIVKGGALLVTLIATPAYIRFFNDNSALGVWYTLLSVITWILNFDLGIGNGLRNKLTGSLAQNDRNRSKLYISSAYLSIGIIVAFAAIILIFLVDNINWNMVFNIKTEIISKQALTLAVKIILGGILAQFLLKLISSILYALQLSSINNALALCTSIITLGYVLLAKPGTNDENIITMAIVHAIAVLLPLVITSVIVFCGKLKDVRPSIFLFSKKCAKEILGLGGTFFVVQIAYMIVINTNEFFISNLTDSANVVNYQIYYKLFTLIGTLASLSLTPIWSAITKAFAERNFKWISNLYNKMIILGWASCFFEFLFIFGLQLAVNIWLKNNAITVSYQYAISFAILGSCMVMNGILTSLANGLGRLMPQIIFYGVGAVLKYPLAKLLVVITDSWIGVILAVDIILVIFVFAQYIINKKTIIEFRRN